MKVLIVGNGGREHAITWKLSLSPMVNKLFCYPGNGGTAKIAENVVLEPFSIQSLADFAASNQINLTVVGPETYLAQGIVAEFQKKGLKIYGPSIQAAQLEASKIYAKEFMKKHHIPTAQFETFEDPVSAKKYLEKVGTPIVVKANGLAAGKGVVVAFDRQTALRAIDEMMTKKIFGAAGESIVIEEYLEGEEVSLMAFCDGKNAIPMLPVQDHKRIGDGDTGPNTGGMGTYTPTTIYTKEIAECVNNEILNPTMQAMAAEGTPFVGTLFLGLIITRQGPKLIEYNVRFGDPETQAVLPLLDSDLAMILLNAVNGELHSRLIKWQPRVTAVCIVAASAGYPGKYLTDQIITGVEKIHDSLVFQAGTRLAANGQIFTAGGRVINLVHLGETIKEAIDGAYREINQLNFTGIYYRKDIGQRELNRFEGNP